jgi:hypothetical protein
MDSQGEIHAGEGELRGRRGMIGGVGPSVAGGECSVPLREIARVGRGPVSKLGRFGSLGPFSYFLILFHFFFYFVLFLSYLLQNSFKSIQTNS